MCHGIIWTPRSCPKASWMVCTEMGACHAIQIPLTGISFGNAHKVLGFKPTVLVYADVIFTVLDRIGSGTSSFASLYPRWKKACNPLPWWMESLRMLVDYDRYGIINIGEWNKCWPILRLVCCGHFYQADYIHVKNAVSTKPPSVRPKSESAQLCCYRKMRKK